MGLFLDGGLIVNNLIFDVLIDIYKYNCLVWGDIVCLFGFVVFFGIGVLLLMYV